jgi:uncharacterized RDD family membrane protein YckC
MAWGGTGQNMAPPPVDSGWKMPEVEPGPAPGIEFGGFGERLIAYIIDAVIVSVVVGVVAAIGATAIGLGAAGDSGLAIATGAFVLAVAIVVSIGYFPWFWVRSGQTPGLRTMGLRVVRDVDGGPVDWLHAFLRLFGYWISATVFYLGFIWILIDQRKRGWSDLIAGTVVIRKV